MAWDHKRLQEALADQKFTIRELSKKTRINRRTLQRYLKGQTPPSLSALKVIAEALDVYPSWLAFGEELATDLHDALYGRGYYDSSRGTDQIYNFKGGVITWVDDSYQIVILDHTEPGLRTLKDAYQWIDSFLKDRGMISAAGGNQEKVYSYKNYKIKKVGSFSGYQGQWEVVGQDGQSYGPFPAINKARRSISEGTLKEHPIKAAQ